MIVPAVLTAAVNIGKDIRMIQAVHVGGIVRSEISLPNIPWMKRGACKGTKDPDKFFRERAAKTTDSRYGQARRANISEAKAICGKCRVSSECLLWALQNNEEYGIWGGSTPEERQIMKRYL